jgi:hypothetical protein
MMMPTNRDDLRRELNLEVVMALDAIVGVVPYESKQTYAEELIAAAQSHTDDFSDASQIVKRVSRVIKSIWHDRVCDVMAVKAINQKTDELGSILHIGHAYPEKALVRAKKIRQHFQAVLNDFKKNDKKIQKELAADFVPEGDHVL